MFVEHEAAFGTPFASLDGLIHYKVSSTSKGPINGKTEELIARWVQTGSQLGERLPRLLPYLCTSFLCNGVLTYKAHQVSTAIYKPRSGQQRRPLPICWSALTGNPLYTNP